MGKNIRSFLISFAILFFIFGASFLVIAYGRGYRLDFRKTSVHSTGIISATSDPIGAEVLVDGILQSATNNSFNIEPSWYTIRVTKEGYIDWQKKVRIQGEVVTRIDAFLFPTNPSLSPLSQTGVTNPVLSPDGTKIAYAVPTNPENTTGTKDKAGLWVLELTDRTLGRNRDPQQIAVGNSIFDFTKSTIQWSSDSTEVVVTFNQETNKRSVLYQANRSNSGIDISNNLKETLNEWQTDSVLKIHQQLAAFPREFVDIATSSAKIISFSPDETKLLYEATASATIPEIVHPPLIGTNSTAEQRTISPGKLYVYDIKEDKNYFVLEKTELPQFTPTPTQTKKLLTNPPTKISSLPNQENGLTAPIFWFPTSRHLGLTLPGKIDVMEYDRTNWVTVYSGPFVDHFVAAWTNGSRLVILTNLNPGVSSLPNFYTVNLR